LSQTLWLVLAALLSLPAVSSGWNVLTSTCFLGEFLSGQRWKPLSAITHEVVVHQITASASGRAVAVDIHLAPSFASAPGLVLVHGLSPQGKDDPRLRQAASLLARAGWAVAVPTVEGLTRLRLRPEDSVAVVAAIQALVQETHLPVAVLGVSLGAGPALLAATDPTVSSSVSAVLALGGYASAVELLRYTLTGAYRFGKTERRRPVDEAAIAEFARANRELVDAAGRRLLDNRDPEAVDRLVLALPPDTRRLLDALSTQNEIGRLQAPLFLVHGRDDPAVPFTESLRLEAAARAAGVRVRTVIVGSLSHIEPESRAGPRDLLELWATFYAFETTGKRAVIGGKASERR
jgi:pimeloyl-ACP methyl ester carboxylesterase